MITPRSARGKLPSTRFGAVRPLPAGRNAYPARSNAPAPSS